MRQQPRSPPSPSTTSSGLAVVSAHCLARDTVGGPVASHILNVLLLMIQSKRPPALLTQSQGHLATSPCHMGTSETEPHPALEVSGSVRRLWLGAPFKVHMSESVLAPPDSFLDSVSIRTFLLPPDLKSRTHSVNNTTEPRRDRSFPLTISHLPHHTGTQQPGRP